MIFLVVMPTLVGLRQLPRAADDRRARHGVPAPQRDQLLAPPVRRASSCTSACWRAARRRRAGSATRRSARRRSPRRTGTDYWVLALLVLGIGSVATARSTSSRRSSRCARPGLTMRRLPLFVWMTFVTSILVILALPVLNASLVDAPHRPAARRALLPARAAAATRSSGSTSSGPSDTPRSTSWRCPAFGMISEIIPVFSRKPIFGYEFVAASTVAIAHPQLRRVGAPHVRGRASGTRPTSSSSAGACSSPCPTGVKIFNWIATHVGRLDPLHDGDALRHRVPRRVRHRRPQRHHVRRRADRLAGDRHVLRRRALPLRRSSAAPPSRSSAAIYYWFPKMSGRLLVERLGKCELLARWSRVQPDVLRPALPRHHGHAAARVHLPRSAVLGRAQHGLHGRRVRHGRWRRSSSSRTSSSACGAASPPATTPGTRGRSSGRRRRRRRTTTSTAVPPVHGPPPALGPRARRRRRPSRADAEARAHARQERRRGLELHRVRGRVLPHPDPRLRLLQLRRRAAPGPTAASVLDVEKTGVVHRVPPREQRHALARRRSASSKQGHAAARRLARRDDRCSAPCSWSARAASTWASSSAASASRRTSSRRRSSRSPASTGST